jgi:formylglycine-generating enzyme required for sulfatase activity
VIEQALDAAQCVIVLWSKSSVGSDWVIEEATEGKRKVLLPALIDDVEIPLGFRLIHTANLIDWQGESSHPELNHLLEEVATILGVENPETKPGTPTVAPEAVSQQLPKEPEKPPRELWLDRLFGDNQFVLIPAGEFLMGSENGDSNERPIHRVWISRDFEMGKYPVTQAQWEAVMGSNPSHFNGADRPVEKVSWNDVQRFIDKLNQWDSKYQYRLPTEAEWEYACRAGSTGDYAGDLEAMAWYFDKSGDGTHPVGQKQPNAWGLYDMHGNVWEWVQDWYDSGYYAQSPAADPQGPTSGSHQVLRGGGWDGYAQNCRSAARDSGSPADRYGSLGLRLVRTAR